ncbi:helix-turn-helix domain-containing protein [Synechococcus sp. CBW1108]|uniref:helix-turn-helix domain-containing protein n=1 Tax=Synechococcus sp. CBW1108 TaxID=1353147 RepID=UPI0018CCBC02|nr:helix-turn-helix domain-containing protein [Synechococcus sp. CBW1108]QPN69391.1 helix-turn-helix domain-containing protein [Synechococcus sp. CBW1108]
MPVPCPNNATGGLSALGEALRHGREAQGLSIAELAGRLNMGLEQLQALEAGDASRLPEAVFVIAQARRVASNLAIDISGPLQMLRASGPFQPQAASAQTPLAPGPTGPRPRPQILGPMALAAAILAGVATGGNLLRQQWLQQRAQPGPAGSRIPIPTAAQPAAVATSSPELVLRSQEPSWLEVKAEAGKVLFRGTFNGERRFPLGGGLQVLAGRPDLVQAQLGTAASRVLGPIDQVRWQRFSAPAP